MKKIWDIKVFMLKNSKYRTKISYLGGRAIKGTGKTAALSYSDAVVKMVIKPWLVNG